MIGYRGSNPAGRSTPLIGRANAPAEPAGIDSEAAAQRAIPFRRPSPFRPLPKWQGAGPTRAGREILQENTAARRHPGWRAEGFGSSPVKEELNALRSWPAISSAGEPTTVATRAPIRNRTSGVNVKVQVSAEAASEPVMGMPSAVTCRPLPTETGSIAWSRGGNRPNDTQNGPFTRTGKTTRGCVGSPPAATSRSSIRP